MCSSKLKKTIKKIDPLMGGDVILDKIGLPSVFGEENGLLAEPEVPTVTGVAPVDDAPTQVDAGVLEARDDERRRRLAAAGAGSTILTGASGINTAASTGQKTLLGA